MSMGYEEPHSYPYQKIYDIDSVGKGFQKGKGFGKGKGDGSCHICGQMDHWSRECPSNPKGYGKGGKGGKGGKEGKEGKEMCGTYSKAPIVRYL